jgi:hypothetical protein
MRPGACDVKQSLLGMKHSWTSALILNRTALSQVASAISVLLRPWMRRISFSVTSAAGGCFTCLHCWRRFGMCITTPYEWHLVWLYNFFSLQLSAAAPLSKLRVVCVCLRLWMNSLNPTQFSQSGWPFLTSSGILLPVCRRHRREWR